MNIHRPLRKGWIASKTRTIQTVQDVQALKRPEVWINQKPMQVSGLTVQHIPWAPRNVFETNRPKAGKIRIEMYVGGHRVRMITDDKVPLGVVWCDIDGEGRDVMQVGQVHVKPSGHVHIQLTIVINKAPYSLYVHVFGVKLDTGKGDGRQSNIAV